MEDKPLARFDRAGVYEPRSIAPRTGAALRRERPCRIGRVAVVGLRRQEPGTRVRAGQQRQDTGPYQIANTAARSSSNWAAVTTVMRLASTAGVHAGTFTPAVV
jgi:hypothetical protein